MQFRGFKGSNVQNDSQIKVGNWIVIRSQTNSTWRKIENLKIKWENLQTHSLGSTSGSSQSVGWLVRPWNCYYQISWWSWGEKNWIDFLTRNSKYPTWINWQIHCCRFRWMLGCYVLSWSLRLCQSTWW